MDKRQQDLGKLEVNQMKFGLGIFMIQDGSDIYRVTKEVGGYRCSCGSETVGSCIHIDAASSLRINPIKIRNYHNALYDCGILLQNIKDYSLENFNTEIDDSRLWDLLQEANRAFLTLDESLKNYEKAISKAREHFQVVELDSNEDNLRFYRTILLSRSDSINTAKIKGSDRGASIAERIEALSVFTVPTKDGRLLRIKISMEGTMDLEIALLEG